MVVVAVSKFERFFRSVAGLDVDKDDLKRHGDFVNRKLVDLLVRGEATAKANGRDIIEPFDLPITKGLQERIREFGRMGSADEMRQWMGQALRRPPDDITFGDETEEFLADVFGGISIVLARSFRVVDPEVENPQSQHWDRAFELYRMVL